MIENKPIIVPLALFIFISIVVIIAIILIYKYFNKRLSLKVAIEVLKNNDKEMDRSLLELLVKEKPKLNFDLRVGILCIVIAFVFFILGFSLDSDEYRSVQLSLYGVGLFPGLIGLTLLCFHFLKIKNT